MAVCVVVSEWLSRCHGGCSGRAYFLLSESSACCENILCSGDKVVCIQFNLFLSSTTTSCMVISVWETLLKTGKQLDQRGWNSSRRRRCIKRRIISGQGLYEYYYAKSSKVERPRGVVCWFSAQFVAIRNSLGIQMGCFSLFSWEKSQLQWICKF